jgi:hypothetical protein
LAETQDQLNIPEVSKVMTKVADELWDDDGTLEDLVVRQVHEWQYVYRVRYADTEDFVTGTIDFDR